MSEYIPKVGDLIRDKEYKDDMGVIVEVNKRSYTNHYRIVSPRNLSANWFPLDYVKDECEVVCESR